MSTGNTDIHALSGAYAVDALDDAERVEFERHLAECESCRAEVASLREAATTLADLGPIEPPAALRERVLAEIATVRPLPPITASPVADDTHAGQTLAPVRALRGRGPLIRRASLLVAAAAVLVAVGVQHPWTDSTPPTLSAVAQVTSAPDAQRFRQALPDDSVVTLYRSRALDRAAVVVHDLPVPDGGHVYELWLQDPQGAMKPAGLLPRRRDAEVVLSGAAADAQGFGITVEPAGGSQAPTSSPIALVALPEV